MEKNIKKNFIKYISIDNNIKNKEKDLKILKNEKKKLSINIINFIEKNKYFDSDIKVGKSRISYIKKEYKSSLTQSFLKESIELYFINKYPNMNKEKCNVIANDLFNFINNSRKINIKPILKRINK